MRLERESRIRKIRVWEESRIFACTGSAYITAEYSSTLTAERGHPLKTSRLIEASPVYYGWFVVLASTVGMAFTIPGQTVGVSLFIDGIMADLGLSRSAVSAAYTGATLIGALSLTFIGRWIDQIGPRRAVIVIAVVFALGCSNAR